MNKAELTKKLSRDYDEMIARRKTETIDLTPAMTPEEIADCETYIIKPDPFPSVKRPFENSIRRLMEMNPGMIQIEPENKLLDEMTNEEIDAAFSDAISKHPKGNMSEMSMAASIMGRKGGKSKSPAKVAAVRANGKKGGRPRKFTAGGETQTGATSPTREFTEKDLPF
jgi:hypothetical protein